jgi:hypothetical protein
MRADDSSAWAAIARIEAPAACAARIASSRSWDAWAALAAALRTLARAASTWSVTWSVFRKRSWGASG